MVQEEILRLFLDVPEKQVKNLYTKAENFISNLQYGEGEECISDQQEADEKTQKEDDDDELTHNLTNRRQKKAKTNRGTHKFLFPIILIFCVIINGYFGWNFYRCYDLLTDDDNLVKEINSTASAESFYYFVYNSQAQIYLNSSQTIKNTDTGTVLRENINNLYSIDMILHEEHAKNNNLFNEDFRKQYNSIMMSNPCPLVDSIVAPDDCKNFDTGYITQGMSLGFSMFYDN